MEVDLHSFSMGERLLNRDDSTEAALKAAKVWLLITHIVLDNNFMAVGFHWQIRSDFIHIQLNCHLAFTFKWKWNGGSNRSFVPHCDAHPNETNYQKRKNNQERELGSIHLLLIGWRESAECERADDSKNGMGFKQTKWLEESPERSLHNKTHLENR